MLISFFEEFPNKKNLAKLRFVDWKTKVYMAATSVFAYQKFVPVVNEAVYWPILTHKEGYWISPFSNKEALQRIFQELEGTTFPVMLDLELPTTKNPWLYLTQSPHFFANKRMIEDFIMHHKGKVYLAEYYPEGKFREKILEVFGLHYRSKAHVIKMIYHSLHSFNEAFIRKELAQGVATYGHRFIVALGTIATGIAGWEPLLEVKLLNRDLELAKEAGVQEVVIFRLGGLNEQYAKVLKKFT